MTKHVGNLCSALAVAAVVTVIGCAVRQADSRTGDEGLKARVEAVLASASDVSSARIAVDAVRGVVTLTGQVASVNEQQSLGAIVRAVPGVTEVSFLLSIEDRDDRDGQEGARGLR